MLPGSPAIDAGNNALAVLLKVDQADRTGMTGAVPLTTDQRGFARIVAGTVDVGADEYQSDLGVTLESSRSTTYTGGSLTYLVTVTNEGPDAAAPVVTDALPSGTSLQSWSTMASGWLLTTSTVGGQVTAIATLPAGQTLAAGAPASYTLTVDVSASLGSVVNDSAAVGPSAHDTNLANNTSNTVQSAVGLGVTSFAAVAPNPRISPVTAIDVTTSWLMDTTPPASTISPLPARESTLAFPVTATGTDGGAPPSGISFYDIYSSTNGKPWTFWTQVPASSPTATFTGRSSTTYSFFSFADDYAGNAEVKPPAIDASTFVPDLTPPVTVVDGPSGTNPSTVDAATGTFTLNLTGSDPGGGLVTYFEVFVSIDGGAYQELGPYAIPAGPAGTGGTCHATVSYRGLTNGAPHTYSFYSIGLDSAGNLQSAPSSPNLTFANETFAKPTQLQVTSFTVEHDSPGRSFVRDLDIGFNESDSQSGGDMTAIVNSIVTASPDIQVYKYDLNGDASSQTPVSLSGVSVRVIDHGRKVGPSEPDFHRDDATRLTVRGLPMRFHCRQNVSPGQPARDHAHRRGPGCRRFVHHQPGTALGKWFDLCRHEYFF